MHVENQTQKHVLHGLTMFQQASALKPQLDQDRYSCDWLTAFLSSIGSHIPDPHNIKKRPTAGTAFQLLYRAARFMKTIPNMLSLIHI